MVLLNKANELILTRVAQTPLITLTTEARFCFNLSACNVFKIEKGKYAHLIKDGRNWYILINDDEKGYKLMLMRKDAQSFHFASKGLSIYFESQTKHKAPCSFFIQKAEVKYEGQPLLEILADKTIKQIGRD